MVAGVATGNWNLKQANDLSRRGRMAPSETAGQATVFRGGPQFGTSSASWSEGGRLRAIPDSFNGSWGGAGGLAEAWPSR